MKGSVLTFATLLGAVAASAMEQRAPHKHHGPKHEQMHAGGYPMSPQHDHAPPAPANDNCACTTIYTTYYGQPTLVAESNNSGAALPAPPMKGSNSNSEDTSVAQSNQNAGGSSYPSSNGGSSYPSSNSGSSSSNSSYSGSSSEGPGYSGSGKQWAMTYSPYQGSSASASSCKSADQVMQDIASIHAKGFSSVRIYGTDCNQVENVLAACGQYGMKVILGIFIEEAGICTDSYNQLQDIITACSGKWDMVELVVVGNEAIFNGYCTGSEMASFITHCKQELKSGGYTGWVTTTDTVSAFQANAGELCPVIDCVGGNMHPFFNGNVQPSGAGAFVASQVALLQAACPNKQVYNFETGWPTQGPNYMNCVPSAENQAECIKSLLASDHCGRTVFFTMENDMWKDNGSPSVEPYWGCLPQFSA